MHKDDLDKNAWPQTNMEGGNDGASRVLGIRILVQFIQGIQMSLIEVECTFAFDHTDRMESDFQ